MRFRKDLSGHYIRAATTVLALVALTSPVIADAGSVDDPAEGYTIDAVSAEHRHPRLAPAVTIAHVIHMAEPWASPDLPLVRMVLRLKNAEGPRRRWIVIEPNRDGSLRGIVHDGRRFLGYAYAWRPDDRSLRVEFPNDVLGGAESYRWSANVYQPCPEEESSCSRNWDRIPDRGKVRHGIRG